jgi:hypothetical protein
MQGHHAYSHPVARAVAVARLKARARDIKIHLHMLQEGEDCAELLADAAWVISIGAEVALQELTASHSMLRRLHGALRAIQSMCLQGYRWHADQALPLDQALGHANNMLLANEALAYKMMPGAEYFAQRIKARIVDGTEVAGAELYAEAQA